MFPIRLSKNWNFLENILLYETHPSRLSHLGKERNYTTWITTLRKILKEEWKTPIFGPDLDLFYICRLMKIYEVSLFIQMKIFSTIFNKTVYSRLSITLIKCSFLYTLYLTRYPYPWNFITSVPPLVDFNEIEV